MAWRKTPSIERARVDFHRFCMRRILHATYRALHGWFVCIPRLFYIPSGSRFIFRFTLATASGFFPLPQGSRFLKRGISCQRSRTIAIGVGVAVCPWAKTHSNSPAQLNLCFHFETNDAWAHALPASPSNIKSGVKTATRCRDNDRVSVMISKIIVVDQMSKHGHPRVLPSPVEARNKPLDGSACVINFTVLLRRRR